MSSISLKNSSFTLFNDNEREVHLVLVYNHEHVYEDSKLREMLETFLSSLEDYGLEFESIRSKVEEEITFIKVHAPKDVLLVFADTFDIPLAYQTKFFRPKAKVYCTFMENKLTSVRNEDDELYRRAPNAVPERQPVDISSAETIEIIYKMMQFLVFQDGKNKQRNYHIHKLLDKGVFLTMYPLHHGHSTEWPTTGPVTDRQLLANFWANWRSWYKQQPLNLVERYFGTEVAFYFAWLGFYNKMLILPAIVGLLLFITGFFISLKETNNRVKEVCGSNQILCALCHPKYCKFVYFRSFCVSAMVSYINDNNATAVFAILMLFWASLVVKYWKREEEILKLRWDVIYVEVDTAIRPQYKKRTKYRKRSIYTGKITPYVPKRIRLLKNSFTIITVLLLITCAIAAVISLQVYQLTLSTLLTRNYSGSIMKKNQTLLITASSSVIMMIFMSIFSKIYTKVAFWLTRFENHRTQVQFDNSFIYKCYALAFVNNYTILFYLAFFKGTFYTYPGDEALWLSVGDLRRARCNPLGFIVKHNAKWKSQNLAQWEKEYFLNPSDPYFLISEYMETIIQYGYVTFFVAVFPLGPFAALIKNICEVRIDANKFVHAFRRPIPKKVSGLGAWNGILKAAAYTSIITNVFIIGITSQFVPLQIYSFTVDRDLKAYVNSTLSVFNTTDYVEMMMLSDRLQHVKLCYYPGKRYPPHHTKKYQLTQAYYSETIARLLFILIFEQIVLILTGLLTYSIPDRPFSVREQINDEWVKIKEIRMKSNNETYLRMLPQITKKKNLYPTT